MRTLLLEFQAFGPYKGKQSLDFTTLGEESLFLITGPTGAGKTTIFDAICYSLYGRASGADREYDTLRSDFSDHSTETFVQFTFAVKNQKYRVLRKPKQWVPKLRGEGLKEEPATAVLETYIDDQFVVTESKIQEVNDKIKAILGLDYDQFLKMIMIPQGEFRRMISENSQEREQILQKLFQTIRYSHLQDYFKNQTKMLEETVKDSKKDLTFQWQRLPFDDSVDLEALTTLELMDELKAKMTHAEKQFLELTKQQSTLQQDIENVTTTLQQQTQLQQAFNDYEVNNKALNELLTEETEINDMRLSLTQAEKAMSLHHFFEDHLSRNKEVEDKQSVVTRLKQSYDETKVAFNKQQAYVQSLEENLERYERLKEALSKEREQLSEWKAFDEHAQAKIDKEKVVQNLTNELNNQLDRLSAMKQAIKEKEAKLEHRHEVETDVIKAVNLEEKQVKDVNNLKVALDEERTLMTLRQTFKQTQTVKTQLKNKLDEIKNKEQALEQTWRAGYAYRLSRQLTSGEACPVCGALEHPGINHQPVDLVSDEQLKEVKEEREQKERAYREQEQKLHALTLKGEHQRDIVQRMLKNVSIDQVDTVTEPILIRLIEAAKAELETIRLSVKQTKAKQQTLKELSSALELERQKVETIEQHINELKEKTESAQNAYHKLQTELDVLQKRLPSGYKSYDDFLKHYKDKQNKVTDFYANYENNQQDLIKITSDKQRLETEIETVQKHLAELVERKEKSQSAFRQALKQSSFDDEADFLQAKQTDKQMDSLRERINVFEEKRQTYKIKLETLAETIKDQAKPDLQPLQDQKRELNEKMNDTIKDMTRTEELIGLMKDVEKRVNEKLKKVETEEKRYQRMKKLADLSRGDNHLKLSFERFVLSSFLDDILIKANQRLIELTDYRYQLRRSHQVAKHGAQSGLDLEVIDHHTSKVRSVKTLSGGEGFKASLSLALGMADVVQAYSGGIQLDTLFIDEGFGTLDTISLEQAINTLKGLKQQHRILGIISHVPQLKEEIYAKLEITTSPTGSAAGFTF